MKYKGFLAFLAAVFNLEGYFSVSYSLTPQDYLNQMTEQTVNNAEEVKSIAATLSYYASLQDRKVPAWCPQTEDPTDETQKKFVSSVFIEAPKIYETVVAAQEPEELRVQEYIGCIEPTHWTGANYNAFLLWNSLYIMRFGNYAANDRSVQIVAEWILYEQRQDGHTTYQYDATMLQAAVQDVQKYMRALGLYDLIEEAALLDYSTSQDESNPKDIAPWVNGWYDNNNGKLERGLHTIEIKNGKIKYYKREPNEVQQSKSVGMFGIENAGNKCYLDALIQAMYASQTIREFIQELSEKDDATSPINKTDETNHKTEETNPLNISGLIQEIFTALDQGRIDSAQMKGYTEQLQRRLKIHFCKNTRSMIEGKYKGTAEDAAEEYDKERCEKINKATARVEAAQQELARAKQTKDKRAIQAAQAREASAQSNLADVNAGGIIENLTRSTQQDAQETLGILLDALENETRSIANASKYETDTKRFASTFMHTVVTLMTPKNCNHLNVACDPILFMSLALTLQNEGPAQNLTSLIERYEEIEDLNAGEYTCNIGACKGTDNQQPFFRKATIHARGKILIIQLKRFIDTVSGTIKVKTRYKYPEKINIHGIPYQLVSTVNHQNQGDSINFGHYTANVKTANGTWKNISDSIVGKETTTMQPDTDKEQVYLLFYERM